MGSWDPGPFSAKIRKVEARLGKLAKIRKVETKGSNKKREERMGSQRSVKHVLGVLEWFYMFTEHCSLKNSLKTSLAFSLPSATPFLDLFPLESSSGK